MKSKILSAVVLFSLTLFSCADISEEKKNDDDGTEAERVTPVFHPSHEPKKQNAPFSDVVQAGDTYYLAGQIGMDHKSRTLVEGGITSETEQAIKNIEAVLRQHQLKLTDVVKATVILSNIDDFAAFNEVYVDYFPQKPARTTFAASGLARDAKIEIDVVAVRSRESD